MANENHNRKAERGKDIPFPRKEQISEVSVFLMAADDLLAAYRRWGGHVAGLISHRCPFTDFAAVLQSHAPDEIKVVLEWQNTVSH